MMRLLWRLKHCRRRPSGAAARLDRRPRQAIWFRRRAIKPAVKSATTQPMRCAFYTRKSTDHNLDLAFNSLDAQREACEAYIKSQAHEG